LLVPPGDHEALARAIIRILKDTGLRQEMGETGFSSVRKRFGVERMIAETAAVYARVTRNG